MGLGREEEDPGDSIAGVWCPVVKLGLARSASFEWRFWADAGVEQAFMPPAWGPPLSTPSRKELGEGPSVKGNSWKAYKPKTSERHSTAKPRTLPSCEGIVSSLLPGLFTGSSLVFSFDSYIFLITEVGVKDGDSYLGGEEKRKIGNTIPRNKQSLHQEDIWQCKGSQLVT